MQEPKEETQTIFQSGESTFEIIDPQPSIEQPKEEPKKEKKPKFTPAKILETLEAEIPGPLPVGGPAIGCNPGSSRRLAGHHLIVPAKS